MVQLTVLFSIFAIVHGQVSGQQSSVSNSNSTSNSSSPKARLFNFGSNGDLSTFLLLNQLSNSNISASCLLALTSLVNQQGSQLYQSSPYSLSLSLNNLLGLPAYSLCNQNSINLSYLLYSTIINGNLGNTNNNNYYNGPCQNPTWSTVTIPLYYGLYSQLMTPDPYRYCNKLCPVNQICQRSTSSFGGIGRCECVNKLVVSNCQPPCPSNQICRTTYYSGRPSFSQCVYRFDPVPPPTQSTVCSLTCNLATHKCVYDFVQRRFVCQCNKFLNLGNSCYPSETRCGLKCLNNLQCLPAVPSFTNYFTGQSYTCQTPRPITAAPSISSCPPNYYHNGVACKPYFGGSING